MEHRGSNNFSDVAVENAIQDLKRIQLKEFDNDSLARPSPVDKNCNFFEEDNNNNNNFDDNGNVEIFSESPKSASRMRMAGTGNEATTASCSESESDDPLELLDNFSSNGSGDEGTWLYQSPGSRGVASDVTPIKNGRLGDGPEFTKRRSKASPLDWLRRDFDQTPSPEVEKARHSLVNKVDEITQGRLDTQTFRIRDSRNQARKSLQELINFSGPHQATSTQTSSHECQTEDAGMQTSILDETHKPKIVGSATVSRSAGRRLQPKLRLNGAPEETPQDEGQDSRSSSPATCSPRPSTGDSPRLLRKTSSTESHPDSRSSPVVWDQSNMDKPADMVDVQVIARMQEDSLRRSIVINRGAEKPKLTGIVQPLTSQNGHAHERGGADQNSSLPSPYTKHGGNSRRIGNGATDEGFSPKPRIGREDSASSMYSVDSNPGSGGVGGGRSGSDSMSAHSGTPPDSPLGGSRSDLQSSSSATRGGRGTARRGGGGGGGGVAPPSAVTRRSLPNLAAQSAGRPQPKAKPAQLSSIRNPQPSLKSHTSDSNLRDKSGLRQPTPTTSRLKPPASSLRAPSPASSANRSVSPGGIPRGIVSPTPRSVPATARGGSSIARPMRGASSSIKPAGIPRGGQTSQPRRSGIQVRGSPRNAAADWEEDYY